MPIIPALGSLRQNHFKFEVSLSYLVRTKSAWAIVLEPASSQHTNKYIKKITVKVYTFHGVYWIKCNLSRCWG